MTDQSDLHRRTLVDLYRQWVDGGRGGQDPALTSHIKHRGELAAAIYRLEAASMPLLEIEDQMDRLEVAMERDPNRDPAEDAVEREIARVQLGVLQEEVRRRSDLVERARQGSAHLPARTDVLGALIEAGRDLEDHGETSDHHTFLIYLVDAARQASERDVAGGLQVAVVLQAVEEYSDERGQESDDLAHWVRAAMALELLTSPFDGFSGQRVHLDPVPLAQAVRAKRLLFAHDRQDPRYEEVDWPLDLTPADVRVLLEDHARASARWGDLGIPERDLERYLAPTRREESGRPPPCPQVVSNDEAYRHAREAGGIRVPLVYPVAPLERNRHVRLLWEEGVTAVPSGNVGLPLYTATGDNRVRWDAGPYPYGVLVSVALPDSEILEVGRGDSVDQESVFERVTREASEEAGGSSEYPAVVREALLREGYRAIARYDYLDEELPFPQELILLDPGPETLAILRGSVPSFTRPPSPLRMPDGDDPLRERRQDGSIPPASRQTAV